MKPEEKYKCGHDRRLIIMDSNPLSISKWLRWKDTVGFDGDKSQCWECWCDENPNTQDTDKSKEA